MNGIDGSGPCGSRGSFRLGQEPFIERFIEACAGHLAETIGPDDIEGIFLCGSFALGEGGISRDSSPALLLSDIDILVVLRGYDVLKRQLPARHELGSSCEALTDDLRFSGRVDVGLMLPEDLERMPPRPGVFDLKRHGRRIFGETDVLDLVPDYPREKIGGREAVILLENRIAALLGLFVDRPAEAEGFPYEFVYEIARVYTDIATALLALSGLYTPGYENRSSAFSEAHRRGKLVARVSDDLAEQVSRWTLYKLAPSSSFLEGGSEPERLIELRDEAARRILSCWSACESLEQGEGLTETSVQQLLDGREPAGGMRTNLRAWRSYLSGRQVGSRLAGFLGAGLGLFRNDPASLVRTTALELLDSYIEGRRGEGVKGVRGLPIRGSLTWDEAASEVFDLWREMVFGR